jgi:hypothetical protein
LALLFPPLPNNKEEGEEVEAEAVTMTETETDTDTETAITVTGTMTGAAITVATMVEIFILNKPRCLIYWNNSIAQKALKINHEKY